MVTVSVVTTTTTTTTTTTSQSCEVSCGCGLWGVVFVCGGDQPLNGVPSASVFTALGLRFRLAVGASQYPEPRDCTD